MRSPFHASLGLALACSILSTVASADAQTEEECIAANESAVALHESGKLLETRRELTACAAPTCPDVVRVSCERRLNDLNGVIPSIVFDVKDPRGNDRADARLTVSGVTYDQSLAGTAISLNPGRQEFKFEAPGQPPLYRVFVLREGEQNRRETIVLGAPIARASSGSQVEPLMAEERAKPGSAQRTWGVVTGIIGVAGMGAGVVTGLVAKGQYTGTLQPQGPWPPGINHDPMCSVGGTCTVAGEAQQSSSHDLANVATGLFVGGAVFVALGVTLFLTAASSDARPAISLQLLPATGGAALRGSW